MRMQSRLAVSAVLIVVACSRATDAATTPGIEGTFVLENVSAQAVPVVIVNDPGVRQLLLSDSIEFRAGTASARSRYRLEFIDRDTTFGATSTVAYRRSRDTVFFLAGTPDTGTFTSTGLLARFRLKPAQGCATVRCPFAYRRLP